VPDSAALDTIRRRIGADAPFAIVNAGAAWPNKRWPPERYGALAAFLRDTCGLTPIVLWGPGEEGLAAAVSAASRDAAMIAPPTSVRDLVAITRAASLVVSGDTGPLHIANAVGTPTVSLFGPTDPERNGPFADADVCVSRFDRCGCHYDRRCHHQPWCMGEMTIDDVCAAVRQRIAAGDRRG
jgi:heptosyltransferase-1